MIFSAYADGEVKKIASSGFDFMSLAPIALIFVVFYFLIFRPQQKKNKAQQDLLKSLKRGDKVLTSSGIMGIVDKVINEQEVSIEIAPQIKVRFLKSVIQEILKESQLSFPKESKGHGSKNQKQSASQIVSIAPPDDDVLLDSEVKESASKL